MLATAALLLVVLVSVAAPAGAAPAAARQQVCDQTGEICHPDTPETIEPKCSLSKDTATPGETITAFLDNVPDGTEATLTYDGTVVGSGTAKAQNGQSTGSLSIDFAVPAGSSTASHEIVFSGAGFKCDMSSDFVLGESVERQPGGGASLVRTGINVAALVAVGIGLILIGVQLVAATRTRRAAAAAGAGNDRSV